MDRCVQLIIYKSDTIFDNIIVKPQCVLRYDQIIKNNQQKKNGADNSIGYACKTIANPICLTTKGLTAYLVSAYIVTLYKSYAYRRNALRILFQWLLYHSFELDHIQIIFIKLKEPRKQFLDYKWNNKLTQIILERQEADHAMSWLSTLGGAFSALGEEFEHCAEMAGKISIRQFELALRLGDPLLVARCRLYSALSLIQRGNLRIPQQIIKNTYKFALKEKDIRLQNMCQGVWAKLQYCHKQYKQQKQSCKIDHVPTNS